MNSKCLCAALMLVISCFDSGCAGEAKLLSTVSMKPESISAVKRESQAEIASGDVGKIPASLEGTLYGNSSFSCSVPRVIVGKWDAPAWIVQKAMSEDEWIAWNDPSSLLDGRLFIHEENDAKDLFKSFYAARYILSKNPELLIELLKKKKDGDDAAADAIMWYAIKSSLPKYGDYSDTIKVNDFSGFSQCKNVYVKLSAYTICSHLVRSDEARLKVCESALRQPITIFHQTVLPYLESMAGKEPEKVKGIVNAFLLSTPAPNDGTAMSSEVNIDVVQWARDIQKSCSEIKSPLPEKQK